MTKLTVDIEDALAAVPYLRRLPQRELKALAGSCEVRRLSKGDRAFGEGQSPVGVFLIIEGRMKVVRSSSKGREQVLHEEGPGVTLGEVPVFDGEGYVGSAIAADEAVLVFVPRMPLLESLNRNPQSASDVIRVLAKRVRKFAGLVEDLSLRAVTERTARYLLREVKRTGQHNLLLPDTRDELAAHLGTVREQVSRALSQFKRAGVIELHGRRVTIVDPARLRRLAG